MSFWNYNSLISYSYEHADIKIDDKLLISDKNKIFIFNQHSGSCGICKMKNNMYKNNIYAQYIIKVSVYKYYIRWFKIKMNVYRIYIRWIKIIMNVYEIYIRWINYKYERI